MNETLNTLSRQVGEHLEKRGRVLATAESCTGGWIAATVTATAGSSGWFDRGFVTYSNEAKHEMLGVAEHTLQQHGAVSEATVCEMVRGALSRSHADIALAVSGIAGPGGATTDKPVGTVCFAWGTPEQLISETLQLPGDRETVRLKAVHHALKRLLSLPEPG